MNFFFHIVLESQMTNHLLFLKTKKMKSIRNLYRILNPKKIYQSLNIIHFYLWKINIIPINKSLQVINSHLMILHILEHFKLNNAKVACTPLPSEYNPAPNPKTTTPQLCSCYQLVIGSLLYIMLGTHPDIAFSVIKMSQFSSNPSKEHLQKALYMV